MKAEKRCGLLFNAMQFWENRRRRLEVKRYGIKSLFDDEIVILCDSGGFTAMTKNIPLTPEWLMDLYSKIKANICAVLDYPLPKGLPQQEVKERLQRTLANTQKMYEMWKESGEGYWLMPVIHAEYPYTIEWYIKKLNEIGEFPIYAVGSIVPKVRSSEPRLAINILVNVRRLLKDKKIHIFGVGYNLSAVGYYLGYTSADSSSYITGRKVILDEKTINLSDVDNFQCNCFICKKAKEENKFNELTIVQHNVVQTIRRIFEIEEAIKENNLEDWLAMKAKKNGYLQKVFEYAKRLKQMYRL